MTSDAHLEPFYFKFSDKSNSHGYPICHLPKDANEKGDTARVRQSASYVILQMKSDVKEDAEILKRKRITQTTPV